VGRAVTTTTTTTTTMTTRAMMTTGSAVTTGAGARARGAHARRLVNRRHPSNGRRATTTTTAAALKDGERVTLHYKMTLADGTVIDDTRSEARQGQPVTITMGDGALFPKISEALSDMSEGEKKTVVLLAADAFGVREDAKVQRFPLSPEEAESMKSQVQVGQLVQLPDGSRALCLALDAESLTLDMNHPLAGQDLTFELELVEVSEGLKIFGTPMVQLKM
jgi:FKBP-type peptidyl-prolyl cis-trans isomerase 2